MVSLLYVLFQITLVFPLLFISQYLWKLYTPFNEQTLMLEKKYSASGFLYFTYILSLAIMMSLAFYGESYTLLKDTIAIVSVYFISNILLIGILIIVNNTIEIFFKK